jgi:flagellin-like protein
MNFKTLFQNDDRAVSPVIGVILMVAITVILAAVIGTFVLGLGDSLGDSTPQASFSIDDVDADNNQIEVTKTGGQDIAYSDLRVVVEGDSNSVEFDLAAFDTDEDPTGDDWRTADTATIKGDDSVSPVITTLKVQGGTATVDETALGITAGNDVSVTIVHKQSGGTIAELSATA